MLSRGPLQPCTEQNHTRFRLRKRWAAQVENQQALANFEAIAAVADGLVLSRGNLGLDVLPEKTAIVQKAATTACNLIGKPVIITRVVDTMVTAPRCTR